MTLDRASVRRQFASLLKARLLGTAEVYEYQLGDFRGKSPVILVTTSSTRRGNPLNNEGSNIRLEVHTFVLYALPPVQLAGTFSPGNDIVIFTDTASSFVLGQTVVLEDENNIGSAVVTVVDPDIAITIDALGTEFVNPSLFTWHELMSEDQIDFLEREISEEVRVANDSDIWLSIVPGDDSVIDMVDIGGNPYRHETIYVNVDVEDF